MEIGCYHLAVRWLLPGLAALSFAIAPANAADDFKVSVTNNVLYLLLPVYEIKAEVSLGGKWGAAVRGGLGDVEAGLGVGTQRVSELGAQAVYYPKGRFGRGFQLGGDVRRMNVRAAEGVERTLVMGLGDGGVAVGPFIGYKRAYGVGFTLEGQLGAQLAFGESDGTVLPFLTLSAGWSFPRQKAPPESRPSAGSSSDSLDSLDQHRGLLFGVSLGGGSIVASGCDACRMRPGIAADGSIGLFVSRRLAVVYDSLGAVAIGVNSPVALGNVLHGPALQYWPHRHVWLKVGVGFAQLVSASPVSAGTSTGGGMTVGAGWEFHHDGNMVMDVALRTSHGEFEDSGIDRDTYAVLLGFKWY